MAVPDQKLGFLINTPTTTKKNNDYSDQIRAK